MPKCQFTTQYYDYEIDDVIHFCCPEEPLASGFCIFHDKDYLQDKTNNEEHRRAVLDRLKHKVNNAISNNKSILCIGFQLPDFNLSDLSISSKEFTKPAYFSGSQFFGNTDFSEAKFQGGASFSGAKFKGGASFSGAKFEGEAIFLGANFQEVHFVLAEFKGRAMFTGANFEEYANFLYANFERGAYFFTAKFKGGAIFTDANFEERVSFAATNFQGVGFARAKFKGRADFHGANFKGEAFFSGEFNGETKFNYVLFEGKEKVIFEIENLSNVSFMNTDLTGVRFSDRARWGEKKVEYDKFWRRKKVKEDRFKIVDERLLEEEIERKKRNKKKNVKPSIENEPAIQKDEKKDGQIRKDLNLGSIKAVYRNLRENYEYRMRYDEAGQFFVREMELKRKYREVVSKEEKEEEVDNNVEMEEEPQPEPEQEEDILEVKQNNWFRRNLFSLTGWYYHLSRYGESLWRPTLAGLLIIIISTLFWSTQENPELKPWLPIFQYDDDTSKVDDDTSKVTKFVGFDKFGDGNHWLKAYERSIAGFIPVLTLGSNIEAGIIDYVIKVVGGAVVFALIAVALRRRFERKYRH